MGGALRAALLALLVSVVGGASTLGAQESVALAGRVLDVEGAPVAGADIALSGPAERHVVSGPDGRWRVSVQPGRYHLSIRHLAYVGVERDARAPASRPLVISLRERVLPLDALVVTAGRRLQTLASVAVTTELVSRAEIRTSGAADLASVLTERTGIQVDGGHPAGAGIMLQGLGSERVLVLVDGQPFIGRLSGNVDISRIPTSLVERVEVVKGPQATMYGSEAMGGVVNVITRNGATEGWGVSGTLSGGTQGRLDGALQVDADVAGVGAWLAVGARSQDLVPGQPDELGASVARRDLALKLERALGDAAKLRVSGLAIDEDQRWASGQLRHFADNLQLSGRATLTWTSGKHRLRPTLRVSSFDHLARRGTAITAPPASTGERQVQRLSELEVLYGWDGDAVQIDAGVEASREVLESASVLGGERTVTEVDPFARATLVLGGVTLVPGLRLSWSDAWGGHVTPKLAAMVRPLPGLALRASVGTGYRAPSSKELYMAFLNTGPGFGYLVKGNAGLGPEGATNVSAAVEWSGARAYVRAQAFRNRYSDFIETRALSDSAGLAIYTYGNIADGLTRGLELEAGLVLPYLSLEGSWSILDAHDRATGLPLLGRPEHAARLTAGVGLPLGLRARVTGLYTGGTPLLREGGETREREAFTRVDLRFARDVTDGVSVAVGIDNLADATPAGWPGFTGRRTYVSVEAGRRWGR